MVLSDRFKIKVDKQGVISITDGDFKIRDNFEKIKSVLGINNRETFLLLLDFFYTNNLDWVNSDEGDNLEKQVKMELARRRDKRYISFSYSYSNVHKQVIELLSTETTPIKTIKRNLERLKDRAEIDPDNKKNWGILVSMSKKKSQKLKILRIKILDLIRSPPYFKLEYLKKFPFEFIHLKHSELNGYAIGQPRIQMLKGKPCIDLGGEKWELKKK